MYTYLTNIFQPAFFSRNGYVIFFSNFVFPYGQNFPNLQEILLKIWPKAPWFCGHLRIWKGFLTFLHPPPHLMGFRIIHKMWQHIGLKDEAPYETSFSTHIGSTSRRSWRHSSFYLYIHTYLCPDHNVRQENQKKKGQGRQTGSLSNTKPDSRVSRNLNVFFILYVGLLCDY